MSAFFLGNITTTTIVTAEIIGQLNKFKLLNCSNVYCHVHSILMNLVENKELLDGFELRCYHCGNRNIKSIRTGSWFEGHHFSIATGIHIINLLQAHAITDCIEKVCSVSRQTIYNIYHDLTARMAKYNELHRPHFKCESDRHTIYSIYEDLAGRMAKYNELHSHIGMLRVYKFHSEE